ncbi:MAG: XRE family transcriptional regulator, partial [Clostridium sp.]|nr:XRE family transcriptional regulator [Clostridium sp.]
MRQHIDSVTLLIDKIKQSFGTNAPAILIGGAAFEQMNYVEMVTGADKYCKDYQDIEKNLKRI